MVLLKSLNNTSTPIATKGACPGTLLLLFLLLASTTAFAHQRDTLNTGGRTYFIENQGQWDGPFLYKAEMPSAAFFAERNGFSIVLKKAKAHPEAHSIHHHVSNILHAYKVHFVGSNANAEIIGKDIDNYSGYDNYYLGKDPTKWVSHLPHYMTVYYSSLYPGIDMDVAVADKALKTNFYIEPGSDPSLITMRYEGVERLYPSNGNLIIRTSVGEIVELSPYAYQESDTGRTEVNVQFYIKGDEVSFSVREYDHTKKLVIDPVLHFSTYTGSTSDNWGTTATYDNMKNAYTAGIIFGTGYPVSAGAYDRTYNGNADIGIFKFNDNGSQRLFATYLGGTMGDMPHSMYVNTFDELVIFGTTGSNDFPVTPDAYDTTFNGGHNIYYETSDINFPTGSDIFVCRFNSTGDQLQASTYVGGSGNDGLNFRSGFNNGNITMEGNDSLYFNYGDGARGELITDDLNNVYVGSTSMSSDFPVSINAIQNHAPQRQNGVVFKLDYNLRNMIWSTYFGGLWDDAVYSIDVDRDYNLVICGGTNSYNLPTTTGCFQANNAGGSADGFIAKISYNGDNLMACTYFGSSAYDQLYFIRCGRNDDVFVYGQTKASGSSMVYNANYSVPGSGMLLARFSPDLSERVWSTVFGTPLGTPNLSPTAFAADICNRVYASGWGRDFVGYNGISWNQRGSTGMETTTDAYQNTTDGQDFYIMSIDEDASHLEYATFFGELHSSQNYHGADHVDGGTSRFDKMATLYQSVCASCGGSNSFPTTNNAWSRNNLSHNCNNAIFRINIHDDFPVADFIAPPVICSSQPVSFTNIGRGDNYLWDFGDGNTSTVSDPSHLYASGGTYTVTLIAYKNNGCRTSDTTQHTVSILNNEGRHYQSVSSCFSAPLQIGPRPMTGCSYEWIIGNVSDRTVANPYVTQNGIYVLHITSTEGCDEYDTFNVRYIDLIDTLIIRNPRCPGGHDGSVTLVLNYDIPADSVRILWDGVPGGTTLSGLSADNIQHHVEAFYNECSIDETYTLQDPPTLSYTVEAQDIICGEGCDGWIRISYSLPDYHVGDTLLDHLCEGSYTVYFADTAGCPYSSTTEIIRDTSLLNLRVWADNQQFFLTESVQLHVTEVPGATYFWSDAQTLNRNDIPNPIATPVDTISVYEVTVVDSLGCSWHGSIMLQCSEVVCGRPNIFIPNTFSPNGDGINDRLCFSGEFILDFELAVFTRWGEKVYETHDIHDCWDGRFNGNPCLPGVYTYYCKIKCEAGLENLLKGDITLIR